MRTWARVAWSAGAGFAILLVLVVLGWPPLATGDADALEPVVDFTRLHETYRDVMTVMTSALESEWTMAAVGAIAVAAALRRRLGLALWLALAVGTGNAAWAILKQLVGRERPRLEAPLDTYSGLSFPSGHATSATLMCAALLLAAWPGLGPAARTAAVALAVAVPAASAWSRLVLGAHYPSDLAGGFLLGVAWIAAWAPALPALRRCLDARPSTVNPPTAHRAR